MAYTQAMDETTPTGATNANTADDEFRALKRDIKERFNSFCADVNTDPCAPDILASIVNVPSSSFVIQQDQGFVNPVRLIEADVSGGVGRMVLGKSNIPYAWNPSAGGGNIAWPCLPVASATAGTFPAYAARLEGLVAMDNGFLRLVFYTAGGRFYINSDGNF